MSTTNKKNYVFNEGANTAVTRVSGINGVALAANPQRLAWGLENVCTGGSLYWAQGETLDSGSFNGILAPATSMFQGDGGKFVDSEGNWKGAVVVSGRALTSVGSQNSVLYSVWEVYNS